MEIDSRKVYEQICGDIQELEKKINQPTKSVALSIAMKVARAYPRDTCSRHTLFDVLMETLLIRLGYGNMIFYIRKFTRWYE